MIYFDNAATGGFKIRAVTDAVETAVRYLSANPSRSSHRLALTGAKIVNSCREVLAQVFGGTMERVIFTKNCTEAINLALFGSLKVGGHIITTIFEHNSVLRPLFQLQQKGLIELDIVAPIKNQPLFQTIKDKIKPSTYLIATTALSNVTGEVLPIAKIGKLAKEKGILFLVDGAQGGGHIHLNLNEQNIDMLCLAGHKGLYGIMGSGVLIFKDNVQLEPILFGGTGSDSLSLISPQSYPEKLEAGTINLPAICALNEGVRYVKDNIDSFSKHLNQATFTLINGLNKIPNVVCYSSPNPAGIVSFKLTNLPSAEVTDILNSEFDVAVRGGLHCAPLMHKHLKTENEGLVRASLAVQNSSHELNHFLNAVKKISNA